MTFSTGDAMLPEIQNTVREPRRKNMYKGVSTVYGVIIRTYWQLAFFDYWELRSEIQPYILASLRGPRWTICMANLFAVIQIAGCYQIYCRPTYKNFEERFLVKETDKFSARNCLVQLMFTSICISLITLVTAAMPFFVDFVSVYGAIGFSPLDLVFPILA